MIKTLRSPLLLRSLLGLWIAPMMVSQLHATVTFEIQVGIARDSSGAAIADGTLWALLVDTNEDNTFTGFAAGSYLSNTAAADAYFSPNQSLSLNQVIGGDTIFAMGSFTGEAANDIVGLANTVIAQLTYGVGNGTAEGRRFAFLWFPGAVYTGLASESIDSQVGGISSIVNDLSGGVDAMVLPTDGSSLETPLGVASNDDMGGSTSSTNFYAVNLTAIPEPTSALLAMLGGLSLVFRRRRVEGC